MRPSQFAMTLALVALLVVDIVLVVLALRAPALDAALSVETSPSPTATDTQTPVEAAEQPAAPPTPPAAVPLARLIDAVSASEAWRARTGSCPGTQGVVERTQDGGVTWSAVDVGVRSFVRLRAESGTKAFVVGAAGDGCETVFADTEDGGESWQQSRANLDVAWYVTPENRAQVHSRAGTAAGPCGGEVADLAPVTAHEAAALCTDGRVFVTGDAAATWQPRAAVPGAIALSDHPRGYAVAVVAATDCPNVAVAVVEGDSVEVVSCTAVTAAPGEVDLAVSDASVWLWAGDSVLRSDDGGSTWR